MNNGENIKTYNPLMDTRRHPVRDVSLGRTIWGIHCLHAVGMQPHYLQWIISGYHPCNDNDWVRGRPRTGKNFVVALFLLFGFFFQALAQEIQLNSKDPQNRETVSVRLYDQNEGNYLLELPLTFHITPNGILFMIVGSDNGISGNDALWLFDKSVSLNDFLKKNKHIGVGKSFKKQTSRLESFFDQSENVEKFTWFDNGYERVQTSPKPVFFKVKDPSKPVVLKLKFYTTVEKNNRTELSSEAGSVKITVSL